MDRAPVELSFDPMPKRTAVGEAILGHLASSLTVRKVSQRLTSAVYEKALDEEGKQLREAKDEVEEQPDCDLFEDENESNS